MSSTRLNIGKRELLRRLRDDGFELERQTGSHMVYKNWRLKRTVTVPDHGEIRGDIVKRIYEAAGWSWRDPDALMKGGNPPSPAAITFSPPPPTTILPSTIELKPAQKQNMPTQEQLQQMFDEACREHGAKPAPQAPVPEAVVAAPEETKKEIVMPAKQKQMRKHKDENTVELIALNCFEEPKLSTYALAKKWEISDGTIKSIRNGHHRRLSQRTKLLLRLAFDDLTPAGAPTIVEEFLANPKNIPEIVRKKLSKATKKAETPPQLAAPTPVVEAPVPKYGYMATPQHAMIGYTPEGTASAPVDEGNASLQDMIDRIRVAMYRRGITKMTIPARGDVVVTQKAILR